MAKEMVYLHETVQIIGQQRAQYMHHMTAYWSPRSRMETGQLCYAVWGTLGSTGNWPEVINLWEYEGWAAFAASLDVGESAPAVRDPTSQDWWAGAAALRSGGFDRVLVGSASNRSVEQLVTDGVKGELYAHDLITLAPGSAPAFLDTVDDVARPCNEALGVHLAGAFRVALRNDNECILIWTINDTAAWAEYERSWSAEGPLTPWRRQLIAANADLKRTILFDSPLSPMKMGRQPESSDRLPMEHFIPRMARSGGLSQVRDLADRVPYVAT
jgi:hypothetical protein